MHQTGCTNRYKIAVVDTAQARIQTNLETVGFAVDTSAVCCSTANLFQSLDGRELSHEEQQIVTKRVRSCSHIR